MTTPPRPDVSDDPPNPASKPQGTLQDQEANMESEGQPAQPVGPETTSKD
jgi:hypothetical protein